MIIGNKETFAIEINIYEFIDNWIFGSFLFWFRGVAVGDIQDKSVDLKGCINWLKDFIDNPRNRFENNLYEKEINEAYLILCANVISSIENELGKEYYQDTYSRFHISHIGMSSFDRYTVLLIENESKQLRCIWQKGQNDIQEVFLPAGVMTVIATEVIAWFESETKKEE